MFVCFVEVVFSKVTRQPRTDVSVITDSFGIWKQALQQQMYCLSVFYLRLGGLSAEPTAMRLQY